MKWLRRLLVLMLLLLLTGGVLVLNAERIFVAPPAHYDVSAGPVELLPPGTVVGTTAPDGWTHLIIKSQPRLASGALDRLGESDIRYATFLFMTTVARVVSKGTGLRSSHVLDAIALGLGTTINGRDTVLSPDTEHARANLGPIFRLILCGAYNKQAEVRLVARSPTFALLDTPALMLRQDRHKDVILRYALLVDAGTGRLDTLVWLIDRTDPAACAEPVEWLPTGKLEQSPLHVDSHEFFFGTAGPRAFAVESIPRGDRRLTLPDDLKTLASQDRLTTDEALYLHQTLRRLMRSAATP